MFAAIIMNCNKLRYCLKDVPLGYLCIVLIDIQTDSICKKLGPKYASVPDAELKDHPDFYEDLLRCACSINRLPVFTKFLI